MTDLDMAITDLGRAIDYFDQGDEDSAYVRVEDALARLTKMQARAVEGYAAYAGDQAWPDFRSDDKHTGYAHHDRALLIPEPTP